MKKTLIAVLTAAAVLTLGAPRVSAHDCGWATAGKILTGVAIGGAVATALSPPPPAVVYAPAPVVYTPAPAVTYVTAPVVTAAPAPVYVRPAPVVVYSAPLYYAPRYYWGPPVVSFRVGYGCHHH